MLGVMLHVLRREFCISIYHRRVSAMRADDEYYYGGP